MVAVVTPGYIRGRLGLPDDSKLNSVIQYAIDASIPLLEAKLGTTLSVRNTVDVFHPTFGSPSRNGFYVLRLSSGMVRGSVPVQVKWGGAVNLIATEIPLSECIVKNELGHVYVPGQYAGDYISVAYSSGIDTASLPPDPVPSWLEEAAAQHAISLMSAQQIGDPTPELSEVFKYMMAASHTILDAHLRVRSYTISPL